MTFLFLAKFYGYKHLLIQVLHPSSLGSDVSIDSLRGVTWNGQKTQQKCKATEMFKKAGSSHPNHLKLSIVIILLSYYILSYYYQIIYYHIIFLLYSYHIIFLLYSYHILLLTLVIHSCLLSVILQSFIHLVRERHVVTTSGSKLDELNLEKSTQCQ